MRTSADRIAGYPGAHARKLAFAQSVVGSRAGAHRQCGHPPRQYRSRRRAGGNWRRRSAPDGWRSRTRNITAGRLRNRHALMPTREQVDRAMQEMERIRPRYRGRLVIDLVVPDYYARRPKACMGGWARRSLNVTPSGRVLPCHAAETIPGLQFWSVRDHPLARDLAQRRRRSRRSAAPTGCRSLAARCELREIDFGGCRCQALAIWGDAGGDRSGLRTVAASCTHAGARGAGFRGATGVRYAYRGRAARGRALLPFQLTERRGRVARIVVVEQLPAVSLRAADLGAPRARAACRPRSGGAYPRPAR